MIFELLYTSVLSQNAPADCVGDIVRNARIFNASADITGLLVFDGERFCQLLEGPPLAVMALAQRIEGDPRHEQFMIAHQETRQGTRRCPNWSMGYALDSGREFMEALHACVGGEAMLKHVQQGTALLDII